MIGYGDSKSVYSFQIHLVILGIALKIPMRKFNYVKSYCHA